MNTNLIILGIILVLCGYGYFEHNRFIKARLELDTFVATTEALQAKQERDNAQAINNALTERDAANNRLRDSQSRTRSLQAALTADRSSKVCFRSQEFGATLSGITGLINEGEAALINFKTCMDSWPR